MVDAQIHPLHIGLQRVAEQLDAGNVHRHHIAGGKLAGIGLQLHVAIPRGNGVCTQHRRVFAQVFQRVLQRGGAADGVAVRVFMAQQQHILGVQQPADQL